MKNKRRTFDIETFQFSQKFIDASTPKQKERYVPKMRVACVYDEDTKKYSYFQDKDAKKLIKYLKEANEVISFNGTGFDVLVLCRHYGLKSKVPEKGKHIDIHKIMSKESGFRVSLNKATRLNLNESKHTCGRAMKELSLTKLKIACRSDVCQTYKLWKLFKNGKLEYPVKSFRGYSESYMGHGEHMPSICPFCHDIASLEFIDENTDDLSEGQLADYLAGLHGSAVCTTCNNVFDWEK